MVDARDKWLKPNGLILPDRCNYYIAAINNNMLIDRSNFWQHVYTFDMRPMIRAVNSEPYLKYVTMEQVCVGVEYMYLNEIALVVVFVNISGGDECVSNQAN